MRKRFLALAISGLTLGLGAGPAMAQDFSGQSAAQFAGSVQAAQSNATSTQYNPSNTNINVRVLSPGDDGDVSQENNSYAEADATNDNTTDQSVSQSQAGGSSGDALQEAAQEAVNLQKATADAESTQVKPQNKNISVRVLSPGDNGSVSQENNSKARSKAENDNDLTQDVTQSQGGGAAPNHLASQSHGDYGKHGGGTGIQAAGQKAINKQYADADAKSVQIKPSNTNISVRVLSPGDDGDVSQENNSYADADAKNKNDTTQDIEQTQSGYGCGCSAGDLIQAAGQFAFNGQAADADAESKQVEPENNAFSLRLKSWGDGGDLSQSNNSWADAYSRNENELGQYLDQSQG